MDDTTRELLGCVSDEYATVVADSRALAAAKASLAQVNGEKRREVAVARRRVDELRKANAAFDAEIRAVDSARGVYHSRMGPRNKRLAQVRADLARTAEQRALHETRTTELRASIAAEYAAIAAIESVLARIHAALGVQKKETAKWRTEAQQSARVVAQLEERVREWRQSNAAFLADLGDRAGRLTTG